MTYTLTWDLYLKQMSAVTERWLAVGGNNVSLVRITFWRSVTDTDTSWECNAEWLSANHSSRGRHIRYHSVTYHPFLPHVITSIASVPSELCYCIQQSLNPTSPSPVCSYFTHGCGYEETPFLSFKVFFEIEISQGNISHFWKYWNGLPCCNQYLNSPNIELFAFLQPQYTSNKQKTWYGRKFLFHKELPAVPGFQLSV